MLLTEEITWCGAGMREHGDFGKTHLLATGRKRFGTGVSKSI